MFIPPSQFNNTLPPGCLHVKVVVSSECSYHRVSLKHVYSLIHADTGSCRRDIYFEYVTSQFIYPDGFANSIKQSAKCLRDHVLFDVSFIEILVS